jgi:uncharacterized protein YcgI (DUF1989 family)
VDNIDEVAQVEIPARAGRGLKLKAGERIRVIDVEGQQCADLFAFNANDVSEYASAEHTRPGINRLFPRPGENFLTNLRRPILFFEQDNSPGVHDMLVAACDPARFSGLGVEGWHASCQENLEQVMAEFGYEHIEIPQPINLFTNIAIKEDHELEWHPAITEPGDDVMMRAEMDCYVVVSSCPQDIVEINARRPGPLLLERA